MTSSPTPSKERAKPYRFRLRKSEWWAIGICLVVAFASILMTTLDSRYPGLQIHRYDLLITIGVITGCIGASAIVIAALNRWENNMVTRAIAAERPTEPLLTGIDRLRRALDESIEFIPEVQTEIDVRTAAIKELQESAEHYEELAKLNRDKAEAVQRLVDETIRRAQAEVLRRSGREQKLYFLAGLAFSIPLGVVGNFVYATLTQ